MVQQSIEFIIKSLFEKKGFAQATKQLDKLSKAAENSQAVMKNAFAAEAQKKNLQLMKKAGATKKEILSNDAKVQDRVTKKVLRLREAERQKAAFMQKVAQQEKIITKSRLDQTKQIKQKNTELQKSLDTQATRQETNLEKGKNGLFGFNRAMGALSILFLSQSISQGIKTMTTSVVSSFMKISQGQTEAGKAVTTLAANFEYLKFTLGNALATALMPMIPTIVSLIEKIADFIQKHPKLISMGVAFGFIAASVALAFAQLILLGAGIKALTGAATLGGGIKMIGSKIGGIGTALLAVNPLILAGAAAVGLLLWNLSKFPEETEYVKNKFKNVFKTLGDSLLDIGNSFTSMFTGIEMSGEDWAKSFAATLGAIFDVVGLAVRGIAATIITVLELIEFVVRGIWNVAEALTKLKENPELGIKQAFKDEFSEIDFFDGTKGAWSKFGDESVGAWNDYWDKLAEIGPKRLSDMSEAEFAQYSKDMLAKAAAADPNNAWLQAVTAEQKMTTQTVTDRVQEHAGMVDSNGLVVESTRELIDVDQFYGEVLAEANQIQENFMATQDLAIINNKTETESIIEKAKAIERENKARADGGRGRGGNSLAASIAEGARRKGVSVSEYTKST